MGSSVMLMTSLLSEVEIKLFWLSARLTNPDFEDTGAATGSIMRPLNANSFGPHILISCLLLGQRLPFGPNDVVAVFDRKNNWSKPFIKPDRLRTTVAIMATLKSPSSRV